MEPILTVLLAVASYGTLALKLWAFWDVTRWDPSSFKAIDSMSRRTWLLVIGAAIVLQLWLGGPSLESPARLLTWAASVVVVLLYLFDARRKLVRQRLTGT